ncbi:hypothetical protein HanIR_Chr10g0452801 [Helianthus annuus]|nr:hypothetical protein HanIR_Chr10g0452801 [Helianthus annuus]
MKMLRSPAPVREDDWCFRLSCQFVVYVVNKRQFDLRSEAVQASAHWRFGCRKVMSTSEVCCKCLRLSCQFCVYVVNKRQLSHISSGKLKTK